MAFFPSNVYEGSGTGVGGVGTGEGAQDPGILKNLVGRVGDYLASPAGPVLLGQLAQAAMEGDQDSWQAGLGRVGVDMGRSNIAAGAAKNQAAERKGVAEMIAQALRGDSFQYTDDGEPGPTTAAFKTAPGGKQTFTLSGDGMMGPERPGREGSVRTGPRQSSGMGTMKDQSSGSKASPGPTTATTPPSTSGAGNLSAGVRRDLPFILAQAVTGSGGGSTPLAGLTPEQITAVTRSDIAGQEVLGRNVGSIFRNMTEQAKRDYWDRLPQKRAVSRSAPTFKLEKGANGNLWYFDNHGVQKDTGVAYQPGFENSKTFDAGGRIGIISPSGHITYIDKDLTPQQGREAAYQNLLMEAGVAPEDADMGAIMAAGGDPDIITGGRNWRDKHKDQIAGLRGKLLTDNSGEEGRRPDAELVNSLSPDDTTKYVYWDLRGANEWLEIPLPVVNGRQMTMADAREKAAMEKVPLETFLDDLYKIQEARGELK